MTLYVRGGGRRLAGAAPDACGQRGACPPLRIVILTIGTRGDVQPFIGVGTALRDAGHAVYVCTTRNFREFVGGHGLEWLDCGVEELKQTDDWLTLSSIDKARLIDGARLIS